MFWLYYVHLSSHPTAVRFSPPKKEIIIKKNLIYDNQLDYMQISDSFSSSLKSFCCLLCELLSKYLNESGLIAENRMMWSCECVHTDSALSRWMKEKNKLEESEWDSFFFSFEGMRSSSSKHGDDDGKEERRKFNSELIEIFFCWRDDEMRSWTTTSATWQTEPKTKGKKTELSTKASNVQNISRRFKFKALKINFPSIFLVLFTSICLLIYPLFCVCAPWWYSNPI